MPNDSISPTRAFLLGATELRCNQCRETLPVDSFYVDSTRGNRYLQPCKSCRSANSHTKVLAARALRPARLLPTERRCSLCKEIKPANEFSRIAKSPHRLTSHCRACRNAQKRQYNETHKEERAESGRRYYRENAPAINARIKACVANNPEKYRAIHSRWKAENKDAVNASTHKRRARLKHNGGEWAEDDWQRLKAQFDWRCLGCGKQEMTDGVTLCFDHIIPLSMGGFNIIENSQCLCRSCNSLKHAKMMDLRDRSYPFKERN